MSFMVCNVENYRFPILGIPLQGLQVRSSVGHTVDGILYCAFWLYCSCRLSPFPVAPLTYVMSFTVFNVKHYRFPILGIPLHGLQVRSSVGNNVPGI